ncbi:MAG: CAP domain-containing protein [Leptospiraceae bacterium]|nr:CAP domain-containing protein [Leptospiraceae bacterium]MCP5511895.1 CAP domain-containing protein [Leptospiraceae bacterium]
MHRNKFILLFVLLFQACIQNFPQCPMDTLTLKKECSETLKQSEKESMIQLLGAAALVSGNSSGSTLSGQALEFYNILVQYRSNGTYTLTSGTVRSFLNASKCSGTTSNHSALNRAAQKHTENMIRYNFFSHTGQDGSTPTDRVKAEGLNVGTGENIAAGYSSAEAVFDGWWNSSGHRKNMETCTYTHVGIGYAEKSSINASASYNQYWTNVFATIK